MAALTVALALGGVGATAAAADPPGKADDATARPGDPAGRRRESSLFPGAPAVAPTLVFTVSSRWLGQSPYRLERDITAKVEQALKSLPGVRQIHSSSLGGRATTEITFDARTDAATTASAIRARLDQIKTRLPRDASPPLIAWRRDPP